METAASLHAFFYISLKLLTKIPLNKEMYSFSLKTLGKERLSMLPKSVAPTETDVHFQSLT